MAYRTWMPCSFHVFLLLTLNRTFFSTDKTAPTNWLSTQSRLWFINFKSTGLVFNAFDYGIEENLNRYGTETPKTYDLKRVTAPVHIFWASNDFIADPAVNMFIWYQFRWFIHIVPFLKKYRTSSGLRIVLET